MNCKSILFGILAVMLIFTSCGKSDDLANAIPADASYVVHIDNEALIKKSEYDIFKNQTVERAVNMAKAFIKDQEQVKLIDAFLKDANSLGFNLKNDVYMYTNYKVYGIVLGVNDAKKVKNSLLVSSLIKEDQITEEGGIYTVSPEKDVCLVWNKDKMLFLVNIGKAYLGSDVDINIVESAKNQLKQTAANSINSNKSFEAFAKKKKDISVFYRTAGLEEFSKLAIDKANLAGGFDFTKYIKEFQGISVGLYGSFEKGAVIYDSEFFYDTEEDKARYTQFVSQFVGQLKGDHLKYFTPEPLFLTSVNIKGESAGKYLKNVGIFNTLSDEMQDSTSVSIVENVLAKIDGDVTFALTGFDTNVDKIAVAVESESDEEFLEEDVDTQHIPQLAFFADIKDSEYIVSLIKDKMTENTKVTTISPSVFSMPYKDNTIIYFGVVNNVFFATNIESIYNNLGASDLKNNYQDKTKGKTMIVFGDLQILKNYLGQDTSFSFSTRDLKAITSMISPLSKYELSVSEDLSSSARLELVNKDQNSLKTICLDIDRLINESAASFF